MSKIRYKDRNFSILTLGCAKNAVDSELIISQLNKNHYNYSQDIKNCELLIINTCGFIKAAKEESTGVIMQAIELKRSGIIKKLIVTGCLSERYHHELKTQMPEVDYIFGINSAREITEALELDYKSNLIGESRILTPKHFAYIKISDGCDNPCSFCAIPLIRGNHQSKPMEMIIDEVKSLAEMGTREFVLIAQDSTYYGLDLYAKRKIAELVDKLSDIVGVQWLRIMYAYPAKFPLELLDIMADKDNICKYIDIPLQHISDNVLKSMRRGISSKQTKSLIDSIRTKIPEIAIRSTFIVGYPNETESDFLSLLDFINDYELDRVGVFTYSQEDDTIAFENGDPIPEEIKEMRRNAIMEKQMHISYKKNQALIGKNFEVLIDERIEDKYVGRTQFDAPEIDNSVIIPSNKKMNVGEFVNVTIAEASEYDLIAELR